MKIDRESQIDLLLNQGKIQGEYVKEPEAVRAAIVEEKHRFLVSFWQICVAGGAFFTVLNAGEQKMVWLGISGTLLALVLMSATMVFEGVIEAGEIRKRGRKVEAHFLCTTEAIRGKNGYGMNLNWKMENIFVQEISVLPFQKRRNRRYWDRKRPFGMQVGNITRFPIFPL